MGSYLSLRNGCYLVKGPKRGAIYDLDKGMIFSLDHVMVHILSLCLEGAPLGKALNDVRGLEKHVRVMEKGIESLPFISMKETCRTPVPISEVVLEGGRERGAAWIELTNKCNMRCVHCYAESGRPLERELTLDEWMDVVDELFSSGFRNFCICGGEPFVFAGLMPLLRHLVDRKSDSILLFTNATLLDEDTAGFLAEHNIGVNITFYSHLSDHHEKISRLTGSWALTLEGIRRVIKAGVSYSINIPLGAYNQDDLEETLDYLESIGVDRGLAGGNIVYPMGRGCDRSVLPDKRTIFSVKRETYQLPMTCGGRLIYSSCWSGKLLIKANGDVTPCPSARDGRFLVGNLREQPLGDILSNEKLRHLWDITLDDVSVCGDCEFRYGCHDCRPDAFAYLGDLHARNPYCLYDPMKGTWTKVERDGGRDENRSLWVRADGFTAWDDDGGMVLHHRQSGALHVLNQAGSTIYRLLDRERSVTDLTNDLTARYEVEEGRARKDVLSMLHQLKEAGIVSCNG